MKYKVNYCFDETIEIEAENEEDAIKQAYEEMDDVISNNGVCIEVEEIDEE